MLKTVLALFVAAVLSQPVHAAEFGSREEAIAMVHRVKELAVRDGAERVIAAINETSEFRDRDLYPFIYTIDGISVAHGANVKMVGKLWISTKDQDGNFLIRNMAEIARRGGSGWVDYKWPDPLTHKISDKAAYIESFGAEQFIGVGIYHH